MEAGDTCRLARAGERRSEPVCTKAREHTSVELAILPRHELGHGCEECLGHRNPSRLSRLRGGSRYPPPAGILVLAVPASAHRLLLVEIAPSQLLEFIYAHPGCVEDEQGKPVGGREQRTDREDVCRRRRIHLFGLLVRELDAASRVSLALPPAVVEDHREARERLSDRLPLESALGVAVGLSWLDGLEESELVLTDDERAEHVQRLAEHARATIRSWAMQHQLEEVRKRWPLESHSTGVEAADGSSAA